MNWKNNLSVTSSENYAKPSITIFRFWISIIG
ncbi:hypothetical protein MHA_1949 [Mannheimia haemolytica PHL213]|nr:hypothetical protein MHA_1949 [Mannheimia haemolytica PHL213]